MYEVESVNCKKNVIFMANWSITCIKSNCCYNQNVQNSLGFLFLFLFGGGRLWHLFLPVLEARSPKSRHQQIQIQCLWRAHFQVPKWPSFLLCPQKEEVCPEQLFNYLDTWTLFSCICSRTSLPQIILHQSENLPCVWGVQVGVPRKVDENVFPTTCVFCLNKWPQFFKIK